MSTGLPLQPQRERAEAGRSATHAERGVTVNNHVPSGAQGNVDTALIVQPHLVLREIVQVVAQALPPNITMSAEVPADLWPIRGDPAAIHQALVNVLLNARAAMPKRGRLILKARNAAVQKDSSAPTANAHVGDWVTVAISNTGPGIYKSPLKEGIGLRLAHVARVVSNHGGFARIASPAGQPTTLTLYFPRATIAREPNDSALPPGQYAADRILIVDDEEAILALVQEILSRAGYRVLVARDGAEALAIFMRRRSEIGLVITDLAMPGMNGFTLIWTLRRSNPGLRVMVATGHDTENNLRELERLGVRHVLVKPFTSQQLVDAISRARAEPVQCEPDLFHVESVVKEATSML